jgi:hypothetical protein
MSRYGNRLRFNKEGFAQCGESGEEYVLNASGIVSLITKS